MTINEFRVWLDGFTAATGGAMTADQVETMRAKLAMVQEPAPPIFSPLEWRPLTSRPDFIPPYTTCGDIMPSVPGSAGMQ